MSMSKEEREALAKSLLVEYANADEVVSKTKQAYEEALKARSEVVERLYTKVGKGPYEYQDKWLGTIVVRGATYFFRGKNETGTIKVG